MDYTTHGILQVRILECSLYLLQGILTDEQTLYLKGKIGSSADFIFLGSKITTDGNCSHEIKRRLLLGRKAMTNLDSIKKQKNHFANKGQYSQSYRFSSSHVQMREMAHKEGWASKNWHFWIVVLEKTLVSPLDCKEIKPVNPIGYQSWIFIGWTDAEAEAPILWPPEVKSWLTGKDPDAGKDWRRKEKRAAKDEMVDSITNSTLGDSEGQGSLACCSLRDSKESDMT